MSEENLPAKVKQVLRTVLILNIIVFLAELFAGIKANSISIIANSMHSGIDGLNNVVLFFLVKIAAEPADEKHHYGHSKFETLGALAVVAFLGITCVEIVEKSITRFFNHEEQIVNIDSLTIWILFITMGINFFVFFYERHCAKKYNSQVLKADSAHTFSDILVTVSILIGSIFISQGYDWLDPLLGLFIAAVIANSGWQIIQENVPILVDEAWIQEKEVKDLILKTPKVKSYRYFRSRKGADIGYIDVVIVFDTDSLAEAHDLAHLIEAKIINQFGLAKINIHIEPF
ncbi:MAG: cation transporter [Candidatus Caenarcaniphilales bacterium]|nr:cation transporter [Candidatus Caenarcaniphilales bacterium]